MEELTVRLPGRVYPQRVHLEGGAVTELARADSPAEGLWLTRGLVDIQVNGYQGVLITSPELSLEGLEHLENELYKQGVSRWCPTVTTNEPSLIRDVLGKLNLALQKKVLRRVHCIHTEANWLSAEEGFRGAHIPRYMSDPSLEEFNSWQAAAGGHIGYVSLAPERKGALEFTRALAGQGVLVALAHHNADYDTVVAAALAGARLSTHLFNGCAAVLPRHNNPIFAQLAEDRLWASFIPDGHHIPYHVLKTGLRAKGLARSVFTSDLVYLGGKPDGEYTKGERTVQVRDGGVFMPGTGLLSGAWRSLAQGVDRAVAFGAVSADQALRLSSLNPAELLGVSGGNQVAPGAGGPFVLFRETQGGLRLERIID